MAQVVALVEIKYFIFLVSPLNTQYCLWCEGNSVKVKKNKWCSMILQTTTATDSYFYRFSYLNSKKFVFVTNSFCILFETHFFKWKCKTTLSWKLNVKGLQIFYFISQLGSFTRFHAQQARNLDNLDEILWPALYALIRDIVGCVVKYNTALCLIRTKLNIIMPQIGNTPTTITFSVMPWLRSPKGLVSRDLFWK